MDEYTELKSQALNNIPKHFEIVDADNTVQQGDMYYSKRTGWTPVQPTQIGIQASKFVCIIRKRGYDAVIRARAEYLTDIGQLSADDKRELASAVKRGYLKKGKGGVYPNLKTVYCAPEFDLVAQREQGLKDFRKAVALDELMAIVRRSNAPI